eukprot:6979105-Prymnesium_polylepis.1
MSLKATEVAPISPWLHSLKPTCGGFQLPLRPTPPPRAHTWDVLAFFAPHSRFLHLLTLFASGSLRRPQPHSPHSLTDCAREHSLLAGSPHSPTTLS